jgi:hypothetical protein
MAINHILKCQGVSDDFIQTEEALRGALVDQYHNDIKVKNTSKNMFYFQESNEDPATFRNKFIELMRGDPEYALLLKSHRRRNPLAVHIDPNEDKEIEMYINNKEKTDTELTLIDAIPLCNSFNVNVVIWICNGSHNVESAELSSYFNYVEGRTTWILMYDKESERFLSRDI